MRLSTSLFLALCFIMTLLGCEKDVVGPIRQDVRAVRESDTNASIDVSHVIQKHIPIGMHRDDVRRVLLNESFELYPYPPKADAPEMLLGTRQENTQGLIGYDQIRVVIEFRGDVATAVSGWIHFNAI